MKSVTLFRKDSHRWLAFGLDRDRPQNLTDTLQYAVSGPDGTMLIDPGGMEVFPAMLSALTRELPVEDVSTILITHQDPDAASSLPLWRRVCRGDVRIMAPSLLVRSLAHLDSEIAISAIPDDGQEIGLGGPVRLRLIPAHHLPAPGHLNVYDPAARILYSGTIGGTDESWDDFFVTDFDRHRARMEISHRRRMGSAKARDIWVDTVSRLDVAMVAPHGGPIVRGDDAARFVDWFGRVEIGTPLSGGRGAG